MFGLETCASGDNTHFSLGSQANNQNSNKNPFAFHLLTTTTAEWAGERVKRAATDRDGEQKNQQKLCQHTHTDNAYRKQRVKFERKSYE